MDELEVVFVAPGDDVCLMHQVEGADELHALEVRAVKLGHHGLHLPAVKHAHEDGLNHVVEVMAQRDFVAAQLAGGVVERAAAHACAGVAGLAVQAPHNLKDVGGHDLERHAEKLDVVGDGLAGVVGVAGVHGEERDLEVATAVAVELLEELGEQKRVLAARDAYGDMVAVANELVVGQGLDERHPQLFAIARDDVALDLCAAGTCGGACAGDTVHVVYLLRR